MSVLKFRVEIDEVEDLYRDIEILSTQTFKEFHDSLLKYFEIVKRKPASFFVSNEKWQKTKEISLGFEGTVDTSIDGLKEQLGKQIGKKSKRLIYINEAFPNLTFLIELISEGGAIIKAKYPVCVKSVGSASLMSTSIDDLFSDNSRHEEGGEDDENEDSASQDSTGEYEDNSSSDGSDYD
jgi:hypothetical protein